MAIDQEIQRKVDAYRGNPQQLMQRYQQNQQLVDLLALQKLKSEKEAAARDMQLQMQQQPQTIKQQREAELLNMTKQEMMQQTQGVLQQRQAQQQQNMQQVAQQGLGALANQRPAAPQPAPQGQPMQRMAAGGIVAFKPGGAVEGENRGARVRERLAEYGITNQDDWQRLPPEVRDRITRAVNAASGTSMLGAIVGLAPAEINDLLADPFKAVGNLGIAASNTGIGMAMGLSDPRRPNEPFEYNANRARMRDTFRENELSAEDAIAGLPAGPTQNLPEDFDISTPMQVPGARNIPTMAGIGALPTGPDIPRGPGQPISAPSMSENATPTPETAPREDGGGATGLASLGVGLGGGGADAAMQRGFQISDQYTGRAEKAGRYADMEAELRALDEEMYDPREERRDQLKAFLAGTANTTNFGSTMAGGTLASLNLRERQKTDRRQRLQDIFEMAERGMTLDSTLAEGGLRLGQTMYSEAMANQRTALQAAATLRTSELRAEIDRAQLDYDRLKDDRSFGLQERELEIEQARNEATQALTTAENDTRRFAAVSTALDRVQDQEAAVREYAVETSQLPTLQDSLALATDEDEVAQIQAAIAAEEARVAVRAEQIFDDMGGVETRDLLAAELLSFTGTGASMLSMEDIAGIEQLDEEE